MDLGDLIAPYAVVLDLRATNKSECLQELARRAAVLVGLDEAVIHRALLEREKLGSTGVGSGVAVPHARIAGLPRIFGLFIRLARPIDFQAVDEEPADLVFLLLAPEPAGPDYMKILAAVSRVLRNPRAREQLHEADGPASVCAVFTGHTAGKAPRSEPGRSEPG